jgi:hypothetical protein
VGIFSRQWWADVGMSETAKALRDGRPLPPPEPHHYRRCRDEDCPEEACRAYRDGRQDGAELDD